MRRYALLTILFVGCSHPEGMQHIAPQQRDARVEQLAKRVSQLETDLKRQREAILSTASEVDWVGERRPSDWTYDSRRMVRRQAEEWLGGERDEEITPASH